MTILAMLGIGVAEGSPTSLDEDPPNAFTDVLADWVIVPSFSELGAISAGRLTEIKVFAGAYRVFRGRPNGQAIVCASARRTTVLRDTRVDLLEYGCKHLAHYRFDPLAWRATTSERIEFFISRSVYRRSGRAWVPVSAKGTRSGFAGISITWTGVSDMEPEAGWVPVTTLTGGPGLIFRKRATVSGVVRFPGLGGIVRLRDAGGAVTWWTGP